MNRVSILVVDDEAPLRELLADFLDLEGYDVVACADIQSASSALAGKEFDLALLDIFLTDEPVGLDLARLILDRSPSTSVVLMTGFADELDIQSGLDEGVHACIRKPFELDDIARVIGAATDRRT